MTEEARHLAIDLSLLIESSVTEILATLLDISKEDSKTLSNKSSAISFKTKIDLLTDIQALDREDAKKFEYFSQIRNQFVHNVNANNFENCFKYIDGLDKKIFKLYPQDENLPKDVQLGKAFFSLFHDLALAFNKLIGKVGQKGYRQGYNDGAILLVDCLIESINELGENIPRNVLDRAEEKYRQRK